MYKPVGNFWVLSILGIAGCQKAAVPVHPAFPLTIMHTNDLHSHFEGLGPDGYFTAAVGDGDPVSGHFARLKSEIDIIRAKKSALGEPVLLLDAGDFFSGTLFHSLGPSAQSTAVPELEFLASAGYDAVTIGNHEFDAGDAGLAEMLRKAKTQGLQVPLLASNLEPSASASLIGPYLSAQTDVAAGFGIHQVLVKELTYQGRKLRVGILGLLGPDAALVSAGSRRDVRFRGFDDQTMKRKQSEFHDAAREAAKTLRNEHHVDLIIATIHAGRPEDEDLAKAVPEIDIVIAGHTHEKYLEFVGQTLISQTGSYGAGLGILELDIDGANAPKLRSEQTYIPLDDLVPADSFWLSRIEELKGEINRLAPKSEMGYGTPIFVASKSLPMVRDPESPLGRMVTTNILAALNSQMKEPVDLFFTSLALVRSGIDLIDNHPTRYQLSDIFRILPIGFDERMTIGSPVVEFYLRKEDLRTLVEFCEVYRHVSANFTPAFSDSLGFSVRRWGVPFLGRIADLRLGGKDFATWPKSVHIATNTVVASYLNKIPSLSYGLLQIVPRDEQGNPVNPLSRGTGNVEFLLLADFLRQRS